MNEEQLAYEFEKRSITLAPIYKRAIAFFIDELVVSVFIFIAFMDTIRNTTNDEDLVMVITSLTPYIIIMKVVYQTFFVWLYGATPGKMLMKIKVIFTYTIDKPNLFSSFLRALGRMVSETFFYIGFIWAYLNPKRQTWQDLAAKTLVINA